MRRVRLVILFAFVLGSGALSVRAFTPVVPTNLHVSGDGAAHLASAIFTRPASLPRAPRAEGAGMQVVALRRWQNLDGLSDLRALCGLACDGGAGVVSIAHISPRGLTRVVILDLSAFGGGAALDAGRPLDPDVADCVADVVQSEMPGPSRGVSRCDPPDIRRVWRPRLS
ncbi:hypothetical protein JSE7799_01185 [Jannaschia seosinensis]|uniref:Uncharacterized protein n=1 Tax=Jannaschia seosinensis TaxID=313367 RepID=A0A0M7B6Z2_9RHOB|nr:hypothetical protein [Jannaschia seosinensis]CUH36166.1 hypothetical protein JSE7799_01185 [Jannaschia seosinensis]